MEPIITTSLLMNIITGLLSVVVVLAIWFVQFYVKTERCKAMRKDRELEEEKKARKEFTDNINSRMDEFLRTNIECQKDIQYIMKEIKELKYDIKELEQKLK